MLIQSNQTTANFNLVTVDNQRLDGPHAATITASVTLTNGQWTGNVTVTSWDFQNVRLTAIDHGVQSSQSGAFDVNGPTVVLTSVNAAGFGLQPAGASDLRRLYEHRARRGHCRAKLRPAFLSPRSASAIPQPFFALGTQPLSSNGVNLLLNGFAGISYQLQSSTNLINWFNVRNFTFTYNLVMLRTAANTNDSSRFYRLVILRGTAPAHGHCGGRTRTMTSLRRRNVGVQGGSK